MKILRRLFFSLATTLYSIIPDLYDIFFRISSSEIFDRDVIKTFSRNIYVIVSACMLFALGIRLLSAIVNPDSFNDSKKGAKRTFLNCFIAVALIAVVPLGFDFARNIQNNLIGVESKEDSEEGSKTKTDGNNLIAVLFLGTNVANNDSIGEVLAKTSFTSFCYLDDRYSEDTRIAFEKLNQDYTEGNMEGVGEYINEKIGGEYEIKFHMILSPLFGGYMVYQMILLCLDVATRAIRLAVLEIMAPLVICAFIFSGTEILQKWFKDVISTYIIVFAKIVGLILTIFGASQVSNLLQKTGSSFSDLGLISRGFVKAAYYIALLTIVKQLPAIINNIFGTNIQEQGGIRGRLGNMAGIGAMAQNAWDQIRQHPLHSAARVLSAPVSAVGGYFSHRGAVYQRANERANEIRRRMQAEGGHTDDEIEAAARRAKYNSIEAGMVGAFGAAFRAGRDGFRNGNLRSIGAQGQRYAERHPADSTFGQRLSDSWRLATGRRTAYEQQLEDDKLIEFQSEAMRRRRQDPVKLSFDELKARQSINNAFNSSQSTIRSKIEEEMNLANSGVRFVVDEVTSTGQRISLEGNATQIRNKIASLDKASAADLGCADDFEKAQLIETLGSKLSDLYDKEGDRLQNLVMHTGSTKGVLTGGRDDSVKQELYSITDLVKNNSFLRETISNKDTSGLIENGDHIITFDKEFRKNARVAVSDDGHLVDRAVTNHDRQIEARATRDRDRNLKASSEAAHNSQNNTGGNSSGASNGGH